MAQRLKRLPPMWETWVQSLGREDSPGEGNGNPLLPGESHGRRSLVGCSSRGCKESGTTERLHFHFHFHFQGWFSYRLMSQGWGVGPWAEHLSNLWQQERGMGFPVLQAVEKPQEICSPVLHLGTSRDWNVDSCRLQRGPVKENHQQLSEAGFPLLTLG